MSILLTGGLGYIGSHTAVSLVEEGFDIVIVDNLSNSSIKTLAKIEEITGKKIKFYEVDVCDAIGLEQIFKENKIETVIHFAGYKAVGESIEKPIMYYKNNLISTLNLCKMMKKYNCKKIANYF